MTSAKALPLRKSSAPGRAGASGKAVSVETAALRATTIRLTPENEHGLRLLNVELRRPINKLVNLAVADFIETKAETLQVKLEQTLAHLKAYRRHDPGFRKAIAQFAEAEATLVDPAEGRSRELPAGPAVTRVREALRGG